MIGTTFPDTLSAQKPGHTTSFEISRGLNISHWLSQSKIRGEKRKNYFTEKDIAAAASHGFDHIRIPIDEEQMWDSTGQKIPEAFDLLHKALGIMQQFELKAIVDLHIIRSHYFLDKSPALFVDEMEQEKFADLWRQLSDELQQYPTDQVAYELLNEAVADDPNDWNKVFRKAYSVVREREPDRYILIGPNGWQDASNFPDLEVPANDERIILSFHFYHPFVITHYRAPWTHIKDYTGPVNYPGLCIQPEDTIGLDTEIRDRIRRFAQTPFDKSSLEKLMQPALDKASETGLKLYCGEFGSYQSIPDSVRYNWYSDMIGIFEKHNIAWTAWDFKSPGFGMLRPTDYELRIPSYILKEN